VKLADKSTVTSCTLTTRMQGKYGDTASE
jgi:hypothetical protein